MNPNLINKWNSSWLIINRINVNYSFYFTIFIVYKEFTHANKSIKFCYFWSNCLRSFLSIILYNIALKLKSEKQSKQTYLKKKKNHNCCKMEAVILRTQISWAFLQLKRTVVLDKKTEINNLIRTNRCRRLVQVEERKKRTVEKKLSPFLLIGANGISDPIIYLTRVSIRVRVRASFSISLYRRCTATAKPMTLLKPREKSPLHPPCCGSAISVVSSDPVPVSDPKL